MIPIDSARSTVRGSTSASAANRSRLRRSTAEEHSARRGRIDGGCAVTYTNKTPMPSTRPATTIRFTDEDREILEELQRLTGLESSAAVIRIAIREALTARKPTRKRAKR